MIRYKYGNMYVWQSRVEIENYSLAYFNHIAVLKVPYCLTSIKGGADMSSGAVDNPLITLLNFC